MQKNDMNVRATPTQKAMEVVDSWFDDGTGKKSSDVQGSYTGMTDRCEAPEQDADDL